MNNFIILKLERLAPFILVIMAVALTAILLYFLPQYTQYTLPSDIMYTLEHLFLVMAIVFSCVYGRYAFEIHNIDKKAYEKNKWYINNQYWLNGLGAFVGWVALYILLFHQMEDVESLKNLGKTELILSVIAFLGITGYIPYILLLKNPFGKI